MTPDQQEMNKIANLLSMWEKKSASSEITISDAVIFIFFPLFR